MILERRLLDLKKDLLHSSGPNISTNKSYPFALFQYSPHEEFKMREKLLELIDELRMKGWSILNIDLFTTFLDFLADEEEGALVDELIKEEKTLYKAYQKNFTYPLSSLKNSFDGYFKKQEAFPQTVLDSIHERTMNSSENRSVIFLSRIGALYPFYRTSSLLRYIDTGIRIPTIVLYPGERLEKYYLSFMGEMGADRDYRPRIY